MSPRAGEDVVKRGAAVRGLALLPERLLRREDRRRDGGRVRLREVRGAHVSPQFLVIDDVPGVSVPPQSKITAATAMDDMLRTGDAAAEVFFRPPGYCGAPPTVWMACGAAPDTFGAVPPASLAIRRTDTGCQRSASSAASTWDWMSPQPVVGQPRHELLAVRADEHDLRRDLGQGGADGPGWRVAGGWRRALISAARPESARSSVAVVHRPLPGMVWAPFTHRSTLTGTKDTGQRHARRARRPAHAGRLARLRAGPPLIVGTGVAGAADDADGAPADAGADAAADARCRRRG